MAVDVGDIRLDEGLRERNDYILRPTLRLWPLPLSNTALWVPTSHVPTFAFPG